MGEERELFLSLTNSYHGETIGALSVGDVELYKKTYSPFTNQNIQTGLFPQKNFGFKPGKEKPGFKAYLEGKVYKEEIL